MSSQRMCISRTSFLLVERLVYLEHLFPLLEEASDRRHMVEVQRHGERLVAVVVFVFRRGNGECV
jgi:hypothetical protein